MKQWHTFLTEKEKDFGKNAVDKWLRSLRIIKFDACNLYLEASDSFQVSWFEEHIRALAQKQLFNANGHLIKIHILFPFKENTPKKEKLESSLPSFSFHSIDDPLPFFESEENRPTLQMLKQTLDEHLSKKPSFNPILIYAGPGCGKTHLLKSSAKYLQDAGMNIALVSCETFTSHVVSAIRVGAMKEFRMTYRSVDALIIDDVHLFSRKIATMEELFHTFNDLHSKGKPIFLSSRVAPQFLDDIEDRLVSRFEWGLLLKLNPLKKPDLFRFAKDTCKRLDLPICGEETVHYLVSTFPSASALMTAFNALLLRTTHSALTELKQENIASLLHDLIERQQKIQITPEVIIQKTSKVFQIPTRDILGKSHSKECAFPRQVAMHLCRELLELSYNQIGAVFSRDHSTVMTSIKRIESGLQKKDRDVLQKIQELHKELNFF